MTKDYPGEQWKEVALGPDFKTESRIEVSNFGRIRTFNKLSDGNIIKGAVTNGYRVLRLKFFKPRDAKTEERFVFLQQQVAKLKQQIRLQQKSGENPDNITASLELLEGLRKKLDKELKTDARKRSIYFQSLFHRLVAEQFCEKPSPEHTVVAHLDHDKSNNKYNNLKWMTTTENYAHQQKSPHVIAEKIDRVKNRKEDSKATKLTVMKVMLLKKLLNEGKSIRKLAKQFKVTDTQILRIKRGENWADIKAAS